MSHSLALATLIASQLDGYRAYDARSLTLRGFLEQQAVALSDPGVFGSGGHWETRRESVTDAADATEIIHTMTVWLARMTGDVDDDMHTLFDTMHGDDGENQYTARGSQWVATIIEAHNQETDFGFPVIEIILEINAA